MRRQELQKMKKLAGLLKEELDISWNPSPGASVYIIYDGANAIKITG